MVGRMFRLVLLVAALALMPSFPVFAQESTEATVPEEATEPETTDQQGNDAGNRTVAQQQYDEGEMRQDDSAAQQTDAQCPSAETLATLTADGDSPVFRLNGNSLLFRIDYDNQGFGAGVGFDILTASGEFVDSVTTGEESGVYELRSNVPPGSYFVEATTFGGSYEATVFGCGVPQSGGPPGGTITGGVPGNVIVATIPEKILANTSGPSPLLPASVLLVGAGLLGFAVICRR